MLTISKPLGAGQAHRYHLEEFGNARENYYTEAEAIRGTWHGQLARDWGLEGVVDAEHFRRLADGLHPHTGEALVRHRAVSSYTNERGETVTPMAHRAGWDATFSAPKSVSITALVGGDVRVRLAHTESVTAVLEALEPYVQARRGDLAPEATGQWVAARFEHDSARPVDGYAAPQLHTHVVVFNVTRTDDGDSRPLQPRELFKSQAYATAVYRAALATRLKALGYELDRGVSGQPEIRGYTPDYLEASSPRRQQIREQLEHGPHRGAEASEIVAHRTRGAKVLHAPEAMQRRHEDLARMFGNQPRQVIETAQTRAVSLDLEAPRISAQAAVTFAKDRNLERDAVVDERALLRDALTRALGEQPVEAITSAFERRIADGAFIEVPSRPGAPGRAFTTPEMIALERETIGLMRAGQHTQAPLSAVTERDLAVSHPHLHDGQRATVAQVMASRDRILALDGVAGAGKTTTLSAVRDVAERAGYRVEGLAPTSRATQALGDAGIRATTLQHHLARGEAAPDTAARLHVLDESSLVSTRQMHDLLQRLGPRDRVLLVGDVREHQAVDAGRPYQQLQEAGMATARLDTIVRQRDPALRAVVEQLARGEVAGAIRRLETQGRVHAIADPQARIEAVARAYLRHPGHTLIVAPDNRSRADLNEVIHHRRQAAGQVSHVEYDAGVLVPRQDLTGADRQWAARYQTGDIVRYTKGSQTHGLEGGDYARVVNVDGDTNRLTVRRAHGARVTYDPRRLQGVTVYREAHRAFATGDRVQFTAPDRDRQIANRELGTIARIDRGGHVQVRLDSGRTVAFALKAQPHLDFGYAVTSHSGQGQTADRVLVHIDTHHAGAQLINQRLAYVAISRRRDDAHIYTDDAARLTEMIRRDISHRSALEPTRIPGAPSASLDTPASGRAVVQQVHEQGFER
jgi:conjugative relaxase-like TrwC/TraI family protein